MSDTVWADPSPPLGPESANGRWQKFTVEAQQHPGRWARFDGFSTRSDAAARCRYLRKEYGLETTTRVEDGRPIVYARWPENGEAPK